MHALMQRKGGGSDSKKVCGAEVIDTDEYMCEGWRESERAMQAVYLPHYTHV